MKRHGSASLLAIHLLERRRMNEDTMLKPALIGGVLLGILSALPLISYFNCFCCAWVIAGGVVAARLYVKGSAVPVTLGRGLTVGLLTGVIGTIVFALFSIPLILMTSHGGSSIMEQLKQVVEQVPNMPPETRKAIESMAAQGGISTLFYIIGFIFTLVVYSLVAMIGGAIGVAIFEKRKTGSGLSDPPPTQPPADLPPPPPPKDAL
jgi:hypothetical protein